MYIATPNVYIYHSNAGLPYTTFKVRQGANSKIVVFHGLSCVLAYVRSESYVFVGNAANF